MRDSHRILLLSFLLLTIPFSAMAQAGRPVRGKVVDPAGEPVAGARVEITGRTTVEAADTDENGRFDVDLPPGKWGLRVSHPAYQLLDRSIDSAVGDLDRSVEKLVCGRGGHGNRHPRR